MPLPLAESATWRMSESQASPKLAVGLGQLLGSPPPEERVEPSRFHTLQEDALAPPVRMPVGSRVPATRRQGAPEGAGETDVEHCEDVEGATSTSCTAQLPVEGQGTSRGVRAPVAAASTMGTARRRTAKASGATRRMTGTGPP